MRSIADIDGRKVPWVNTRQQTEGYIQQHHDAKGIRQGKSIMTLISSRSLGRPTLRDVPVVKRAQMFNQMVATRKPIAILAQAFLYRAVLKHGVVDTGVMPFQVGGTCERLAAVAAREGFDGSRVV